MKKAKGTTPKPAAIAFASGSGLVVSKRFVLTNRHIAQDEKGKLFDGFRVYLGPDYKQSHPARVVAICENYDLALLETTDDLPTPAGGLNVLDGLPPLSQRVTAFGFPLGSRFGVGLTTTGGQISRHPVATSKGDDEEDVAVKSALWHDAVLTSGNSGGPLFTTSKVLVGVNFAYLATDSQHALAVPGNVVADFLRRTSAAAGITFTKTADADAAGADPQELTVFIESMVDNVAGRDPDLEGASSLGDLIVANLKTRLPVLSPAEFRRVEAGDLHRAFRPVKAADIEAGEIARVRGEMTITTISETGMLTMIDGARCLVLFPPGGADEVRARLAKDPDPTGPIDDVYFIGPPATFRTSSGHAIFALVLLPLKPFTESNGYKKVIAEEKSRRETKQTGGLNEQQGRTLDRYLARLRHTFTDATGQYKIDAAIVAYDGRNARLIRVADRQTITVPAEKLSRADRSWLLDNESWVKIYGNRLEELFEADAAAADKTPSAEADR